MKELLSFITTLRDKIKASGNARLIWYIVVAAAVIAAFVLLPDAEISFVYDAF